MYQPPKVGIFTRVDRWLFRQARRLSRRTLDIIRNVLTAIMIFVSILLVLYILSLAVVFNLLDIKIVLSFGVVEFFAFILAKFFLGRQEKYSVNDLIQIALEAPKFSHLEIHYVDVSDDETYPTDPRFIFNTKTVSAFWVTPAMKALGKAGVIQRHEYRTDKELYAFFELGKVNLLRRFPVGDELSLGSMANVHKSISGSD